MDKLTLVCYTILAPLALSSGSVLIYSFCKLGLFKNHPEILIFWQCVAQVFIDLHWFTGIPLFHSALNPTACMILGAAFMYFYYLSWSYNLLLSVEILLKLLNPQNREYHKRRTWYHCFSQTTGLAVFCVLVASGNNGEGILKTCCVEHGSVYEIVMLVPVLLHFPLCCLIIGYSVYISWNTYYAPHLKYHMIVVATFAFSWVPIGLTHGLSYKGFGLNLPIWTVYVSTILGAPSGFFVFVARMMQKGLFRKVILVFFNPSLLKTGVTLQLQTEDSSINSANLSYSDLFEKVSIKGLQDVIVFLNSVMKSSNESREKKDYCEWKFKTDKFHKTLTIMQHNIFAFEEIMKKNNIWYSDIAQSFDVNSNNESFEDRIGIDSTEKNFTFFTSDMEFIVKSIDSREFMSLKSMISAYSKHICSNEGTFIARVFGLFKIKIEGSKAIRIIIMENQGSRLRKCISFNMNGKLGLRSASIPLKRNYSDLSTCCKYTDRDFFETIGCFDLPQVDYFRIIQKLKNDTRLLEKHLMVGYSLVILTEKATCLHSSIIEKDVTAVSDSIIAFIGVVNFLQVFDTKKKMKKRKSQKFFGVSEYTPKSYRKRFMHMVKNIFKEAQIN